MEEKKIQKNNRRESPRILQVLAASSYKTHSLNETMKFLTQNFVNRKRSDRHIWLVGLEISAQDMSETIDSETKNVYV